MRKFLFAILGLVSATIIYHTELAVSIGQFIQNTRLVLSFGIVAIVSAYAYFFIHKVLHQEQRDE